MTPVNRRKPRVLCLFFGGREKANEARFVAEARFESKADELEGTRVDRHKFAPTGQATGKTGAFDEEDEAFDEEFAFITARVVHPSIKVFVRSQNGTNKQGGSSGRVKPCIWSKSSIATSIT